MPPDQPHWQEYEAPGQKPGDTPQPDTPEPVSQVPAPYVPYGDSDLPGPTHTVPGSTFSFGGSGVVVSRVGSRFGMVGAIVGVAAAVIGVGVAIFAASGGVGDGLGGIGASRPDMHSQAGIDDLIGDLKDYGAGTKVYDVTLYPDYAVTEVAVPGGSGQRYDGFYFDGSLDDSWSSGSNPTPEKAFDLADIDGSKLAGFCDQAKKLIDNPGDCYIIVDPSETPQDKTFYSAYVSNDYSEGGYVSFDVNGKEVGRTSW